MPTAIAAPAPSPPAAPATEARGRGGFDGHLSDATAVAAKRHGEAALHGARTVHEGSTQPAAEDAAATPPASRETPKRDARPETAAGVAAALEHDMAQAPAAPSTMGEAAPDAIVAATEPVEPDCVEAPASAPGAALPDEAGTAPVADGLAAPQAEQFGVSAPAQPPQAAPALPVEGAGGQAAGTETVAVVPPREHQADAAALPCPAEAPATSRAAEPPPTRPAGQEDTSRPADGTAHSAAPAAPAPTKLRAEPAQSQATPPVMAHAAAEQARIAEDAAGVVEPTTAEAAGIAPAERVAPGQSATTMPPASPALTAHSIEPAAAPHASRAYTPAAVAPVQQLAPVVFAQAAQGASPARIVVALRPDSLGQVEVVLEAAPEQPPRLHITAERPETLLLLQRDRGVLEASLQAAGLQSQPETVSFSLADPQRQDRPRDQARTPRLAPGRDEGGNLPHADLQAPARIMRRGLLDIAL